MASGLRLRSDGQRKANVAKKTVNSDILRNSIGISTGSHGENRLNLQQVYALETMYQTNSVTQAARTVLSGQLLSGGISLRKNGQDVKLKPAFKDHLDEVWLPFAQDIIDSFLKWGFVVVAYEEFEDLYKRQTPSLKKPRLSKADGSSSTSTSMMPIVPALGTYEVSFKMGGKSGYKREYSVIPTNVNASNQADEAARVFVRQAPDQVGNVNSPLASVFEIGSFVSALTELAIVAESSRARPRMVTQMIKKDTNALDPSNLFFDSDSRNAQTTTDVEESASQAKALQLQQSVCDLINRLQTRQYGPDQQNNSFSGSKSGKQTYVPPDVAPSLFHLPKGHEVAPHTSNPESRGDLESLTRLATEQFSAAFGIPADLIFSGRFAGKSTSQLSLLNTTVSQLAKAVNSVLTVCYRDIYDTGSNEDLGHLQLLTSPLAATDEVVGLYTNGLVPLEIAMPSVLHAIGATQEDIISAVEKAKQKQEEQENREKGEQENKEKDDKLNLQMKEADLRNRTSNADSQQNKETDEKQ